MKDAKLIENFEIALLMSDMEQAKIMTKIFKEFGVLASVYKGLDDFWVALNQGLPHLSIVDVECMSKGNLMLAAHPRVQKCEVPLAFYFQQKNKYLLSSTFKLNSLAHIDAGLDLREQVRNILNRRNKELKYENEKEVMLQRIARLQRRSGEIVSSVQEHRIKSELQEQLEIKVQEFSGYFQNYSFEVAMGVFLSSWSEINSFGIYKLNPTGQKLTSVDLTKDKYQKLPSLWLGKSCNHGIESFGIEMAAQVAKDAISEDMILLKVSGGYENPDLLIFVGINAQENFDLLRFFSWGLLEKALSAFYARELIDHRQEVLHGDMVPIWDVFSLMDHQYYYEQSDEESFIEIDLSQTVSFITEQLNNPFRWKDYYEDMLAAIQKGLPSGTRFAYFGVLKLFVFTDNRNLEHSTELTKNAIRDLSLWEYFEDTSLVMPGNFHPRVNVLTSSAVNYLRKMMRELPATSHKSDSWNKLMSRKAAESAAQLTL